MTAESSNIPLEELRITVGDLRRQLDGYSPNTEVSFSGLDFYRVKQRGDNLIQIEFNQQVWRDRDTGMVYVENLDAEDDEIGPVLVLLVLKTRKGEIITSMQSPVVPVAGTYITVPESPLEHTTYKVERVVHGAVGDLLDHADLYVSKTAWKPPVPRM